METAAESDVKKWEAAVVQVPQNGDILGACNHAGREGWQPWAILPQPDGSLAILLKRPAKLIEVAPASALPKPSLKLEK